MEGSEIPPQIQEKLARLQQMQQSYDAVLLQKQQLDVELSETDSAISELEKPTAGEVVYKQVGRVLIKGEKVAILNELKEKKELLTLRQSSLAKQEIRLKERLNEAQMQLRESIGPQTNT